MNYSFNVETAMAVGVNGAIILQNLAFWIKKNEANETHYYDGFYWTYNSRRAFRTLFPFWTESVIKHALKKLQDEGYILVRQFGKDKMNHTNWYTLTAKAWEIFPQKQQEPAEKKRPIDETNLSNRLDKNHFPTNYTDNKQTDDKQRVRARAREAPPFENPSPSLVDAWNGFVEMRKLIKKPLTPRASKLTADNLQKLAPDDDEHKAAILNQSVQNCWQGVFPLHDDWSKKRASPKPRGQQSVQDMTDETMEILRRQGLV